MTTAHRWVDVTTAADRYRREICEGCGCVRVTCRPVTPADTHHTRDDEETTSDE